MPKSVHVSGSSDGLREALEERLERAGAELVEDSERAEVTIQIGAQGNSDISIVSPGSKSPDSGIIISGASEIIL